LASYPALDLRYTLSADTPSLHELLHAELDAFEPIAIQEDEAGGWRVFFRAAGDRDAGRAALAAAFAGRLESITPVDVDDEGWARRSQANLTAVRVGRIVVAPPWDPIAERAHGPDAGDVVIVIDPSMGFGTGHHETTRLCLELLQELDVRGRRVIDVGTGSGVLAIAAAKLGASAVTAIDSDADALQNARENAGANGVAIDIREADLAALSLPPADIVLANLTGAMLQRHAAALGSLVAPGGTLVVSGFSPGESDDVEAAVAAKVAVKRTAGEWGAAAFTCLNRGIPHP
jgi:ribosomal protein L11 methyltransferase